MLHLISSASLCSAPPHTPKGVGVEQVGSSTAPLSPTSRWSSGARRCSIELLLAVQYENFAPNRAMDGREQVRALRMPGLGKIQRRIVRAFIANPGARLTTMDLIVWSYPRWTDPVHSKSQMPVRRAAEAVANRVGRTYPGGFIWRAKQSPLLPSSKSHDD